MFFNLHVSMAHFDTKRCVGKCFLQVKVFFTNLLLAVIKIDVLLYQIGD